MTHKSNCRCNTCGGDGKVSCSVCKGKKHLKSYIKLIVTWKNHKEDNIVERTALPDHLIRGAQGKVVFNDTQPRVGLVYYFKLIIDVISS